MPKPDAEHGEGLAVEVVDVRRDHAARHEQQQEAAQQVAVHQIAKHPVGGADAEREDDHVVVTQPDVDVAGKRAEEPDRRGEERADHGVDGVGQLPLFQEHPKRVVARQPVRTQPLILSDREKH